MHNQVSYFKGSFLCFTIAATAFALAPSSTFASIVQQWSTTVLFADSPFDSAALGVSAGQIAGFWHGKAILWNTAAPNSWVDLTPAGNVYASASATSDGVQVGEAGAPHACLWHGTANSWVDLNSPNSASSDAIGVGGGQQVGWAIVGVTQDASVWSGTASSWVDLKPANGGTYSAAYGTDGKQQVGFADVPGRRAASLWSGTAASWIDLTPSGASSGVANGISDGQEAGSVTIGGQAHAGIWSGTAASWIDINPLGSTQSNAIGVYAGTQAGYAMIGGQKHASFWRGTSSSWVDLQAFLPSNFDYSVAENVWSDANATYVVGYGHVPGYGVYGTKHAVMWTLPVPEPGPLALTAAGILLVVRRRR